MKYFALFLLTAGALLAQPAAEITGAYSGRLTLSLPDGDRDMSAMIVLKDVDGKLTITAGPDAERQLPASSVKLDGAQLSFKVHPPDASEPWVFDLKAETGRLTGTVMAVRGEDKRPGKVDVKKQ